MIDDNQSVFPMRFKDRTAAGQFLAGQLAVYANRSDVLVLALPRGGVPVAFEVAKSRHAPLDVFLVRKLGVPDHEELAMGAIASGGVQVLNQRIVQKFHLSETTIAQVVVKEQQELERRERLYRNDCPFPDLRGCTVILVDDGLATGATTRAAVMAVRQQQPQRIVVAVPVADPKVCAEFAAEVDETICAVEPERFSSVGHWYKDFSQTTDQEVRHLLEQAAEFSQRSAVSAE